jgi:hypothetical protein
VCLSFIISQCSCQGLEVPLDLSIFVLEVSTLEPDSVKFLLLLCGLVLETIQTGLVDADVIHHSILILFHLPFDLFVCVHCHLSLGSCYLILAL